jgi:hypothetical protein
MAKTFRGTDKQALKRVRRTDRQFRTARRTTRYAAS